MNAKTRPIVLIIDLVFLLIGVINVTELIDILVYKEFYPFGSEFFGPYSIYKSKVVYVFFKSAFTVLILLMITFSMTQLRKAFWFLVFFNTCLVLYVFLSVPV